MDSSTIQMSCDIILGISVPNEKTASQKAKRWQSEPKGLPRFEHRFVKAKLFFSFYT